MIEVADHGFELAVWSPGDGCDGFDGDRNISHPHLQSFFDNLLVFGFKLRGGDIEDSDEVG